MTREVLKRINRNFWLLLVLFMVDKAIMLGMIIYFA